MGFADSEESRRGEAGQGAGQEAASAAERGRPGGGPEEPDCCGAFALALESEAIADRGLGLLGEPQPGPPAVVPGPDPPETVLAGPLHRARSPAKPAAGLQGEGAQAAGRVVGVEEEL